MTEKLGQCQHSLLKLGGNGAVDLMSVFIGVPTLVSGSAMLFFPRKKRLEAEAKVVIRKAQLTAGASERYFEEGRTLDAYPLPATDGKWRTKGAFLTACGIALLCLAYWR